MVIRIILPGEVPISWNQIYESRHWRFRHTEALRVHNTVALYANRCEMVKGLVDIAVIVYFHGRMLDSDNIPVKLYVDGLKGRVIVDDSPKYVRAVTSMSVKGKESRVEIIITEVGK